MTCSVLQWLAEGLFEVSRKTLMSQQLDDDVDDSCTLQFGSQQDVV